MGKMSRQKGKVGEREVAGLLRQHGYEGRRGVQYRGMPGAQDVVGLPGASIEVKRTERFDLYGALEQAKAARMQDEVGVVFHRRNACDWVVVIDAHDFMRLWTASREVSLQDHAKRSEATPDSAGPTVARAA